MEKMVKQIAAPEKKAKLVRYQGRFVKESIGDKFEIQAGGKFTKSWVFRNSGETAWPIDVTFIQTSGDDLGASSVPLAQLVAPETDYTWEASFTAPQKAGRYTAFFRMQTSHGVRFGHKVWTDIIVLDQVVQIEQANPIEEIKPVEEVKIEEKIVYPELPLPEPVKVHVIDEIQGQPIMPADEINVERFWQGYELPHVDGDKVCEAPLNES